MFTPLRFASSPGMTEMVLSARSTLNVLKADTLPRSTNSVTYLQQAGRQKHKNRHTQKGMTTLSNNEPTQRDRKNGDTERDRRERQKRQARSDGNSGGSSQRHRLLRRGSQMVKAAHMDVNWRQTQTYSFTLVANILGVNS